MKTHPSKLQPLMVEAQKARAWLTTFQLIIDQTDLLKLDEKRWDQQEPGEEMPHLNLDLADLSGSFSQLFCTVNRYRKKPVLKIDFCYNSNFCTCHVFRENTRFKKNSLQDILLLLCCHYLLLFETIGTFHIPSKFKMLLTINYSNTQTQKNSYCNIPSINRSVRQMHYSR